MSQNDALEELRESVASRVGFLQATNLIPPGNKISDRIVEDVVREIKWLASTSPSRTITGEGLRDHLNRTLAVAMGSHVDQQGNSWDEAAHSLLFAVVRAAEFAQNRDFGELLWLNP